MTPSNQSPTSRTTSVQTAPQTAKLELSLRVAAVRNKRVERFMARIQRQRERSHIRQRERLLSAARDIAFKRRAATARQA
ncbi:MAG: hypothetical protein KDJ36_05555 [Hyphomicrobiaceae bacterium]|nr:hypothetical protein [Hyphomicrobiaceae bacterium]